jgi:hypothetical protein
MKKKRKMMEKKEQGLCGEWAAQTKSKKNCEEGPAPRPGRRRPCAQRSLKKQDRGKNMCERAA